MLPVCSLLWHWYPWGSAGVSVGLSPILTGFVPVCSQSHPTFSVSGRAVGPDPSSGSPSQPTPRRSGS